jgi:protein-tyrosine phosphatase
MENDLNEVIESELILHSKEPSLSNVFENIFIGNYAAALDKKLLDYYGITYILVSAKNLMEMFPSNYKYKTIPLYDSEYTKITKYFVESNEFIEKGNSVGKILVHCGAGMSRSVSLVIAYMIKHKNIPFSEAMRIIKEKRNVAKPNSGFEKQLRNYSYEILKQF